MAKRKKKQTITVVETKSIPNSISGTRRVKTSRKVKLEAIKNFWLPNGDTVLRGTIIKVDSAELEKYKQSGNYRVIGD